MVDEPMHDVSRFRDRFTTSVQARRYRDRYTTGKRRRIDRVEREALRELLGELDQCSVAMDIPSGTGRLATVLAERADAVVLADTSLAMLKLASQDLPDWPGGYLQTDAQRIALRDGAVDLVFCHRLLHHIHNASARTTMFNEFVRVSRRYVVVSFFTLSLDTRIRRWLKSHLLRAPSDGLPSTIGAFCAEVRAVGFHLIAEKTFRRFPGRAAFLLFERVQP